MNTTALSHQMQPVVTSDGSSKFLALWTSFIGGGNSFDLYAQRYTSSAQILNPPSPPMVTVLSSSVLSVTWPAVQGLNVTGYEVYADGATTPTIVTTNNWWSNTNLAAGSQHWYAYDYIVADGRHSPVSASTTNSTYNAGTYAGIPFDWWVQYFGDGSVTPWPSASADSDGDGVSNLNEFLAGTDPTNANSVLRSWLENTPQGMFLHWNTQPGLLYQVQSSPGVGSWTNLGGPRVAADVTDSLFLGGGGGGFYRIVRLR